MKIKWQLLGVVTLFFFTIQGCTSIPKIQKGTEVKQVYNSKVLLENGQTLKMWKAEESAILKEKSTNTSQKTTIILVRHAEKMKDKKDPDLTFQGLERAERLAQILRPIRLNHVFSTKYRRTQQTATPTALSKELTIEDYNPRALNDFGKMILENYKGQNILVVGHSNTTPELLNFFLKETVVESISESDYGNLYIINIDSNQNAKGVLLRF
ncbi:MAG TPA: hypothetical protein ENJ53_09340 [Phaeodactylibacter sp.]|nr:hypothetical protein [Phaeodactylibacter sp.]